MPVERSFFQKIPFIRICSLFLIGILLNKYVNPDLRWTGIICTILFSAIISLWHNSNFTAVKFQNLLISVGIVLAGVFYPDQIQERQLPSFPRKDYYLAEVCQKPAEKAKTFQSILKIENKSLATPENVIAYFSKDKFDTTITTGDQLILLVKPQEIRNMGNPFEFDYQSMMSKKNIWFSVYLTNGTYKKTRVQVNRVIYWSEQIRDKLVSILKTAIPEKEERSVISALTLGYRAEIDKDTIDYFASTGAMHVLSVSGLHVGLIYFILGFLLAFIKRGRAGSFIFAVVMILFLWIYAFITGFSPSVQRATVMFTFVIIGNNLHRQVNIYNSLTASAFFLILLNPDVIFDIGFQLSYLAVLGIVLIQPVLNKLVELTNPILKWSWSLFTVSVAAQLITFPLGLFYFNQFPNLFWLSGFVVIPITTLIIWITLFFFIFSWWHGFALILGVIIQKITTVMLVVLKEMDALPMAVSKGIVINSSQTLILYGLLASVVVYGFSKKKQWLYSSLILIVLMQCNVILSNLRLQNQKAVYVYNSKNTMIHLIDGRTNFLVTNRPDSISENEWSMIKRVQYHLKLSEPVLIDQSGGYKFESDGIKMANNEIQFLNCRITITNQLNFTKAGFDILTIHLRTVNLSQKEITQTTIATGNSYFNEIQTFPIDFRTKQNGAYFLSLN